MFFVCKRETKNVKKCSLNICFVDIVPRQILRLNCEFLVFLLMWIANASPMENRWNNRSAADRVRHHDWVGRVALSTVVVVVVAALWSIFALTHRQIANGDRGMYSWPTIITPQFCLPAWLLAGYQYLLDARILYYVEFIDRWINMWHRLLHCTSTALIRITFN